MSKLEQVLAVRHQVIRSGFTPCSDMNTLFKPEDVMIGSRAWLEEDEDFLQLIPYCVVTAEDKVLTYSRTNQGGEGRLHGKVSIGFGGHINGFDTVPASLDEGIIGISKTVAKSAYRELEEELLLPIDLDDAYDLNFKGLLFDDSNPVGRVHLGLLLECQLNPELLDVKHKIKSEDKGVNVWGFYLPQYLLSGTDDIELENWSRIALEVLK